MKNDVYNKSVKFAPNLVPLILSGKKTSTWRLFDDKDLKVGDSLDLINREDGKVFAQAKITAAREKKMKDIIAADFDGHEKYESSDKMYEAYIGYYGDKVTPEAVMKIIDFKLV